ncbi:E3 ubiquitin-protein ligase COP1-like [Styela clava]|uniref:E3 ubiquitin-protein ligase COP1-like n=1 Tax=Styela clava TaxID=7725 RepID=UPI00193A073E|nr:E3 ubiquitin-protein ligase COP1-like [Styela clava]
MKRTSGGDHASSSSASSSRPLPSVLGTFRDMNENFVCPICFNLIDEAYMTQCGHTFCYSCLKSSLEQGNKCTKCNTLIKKKDDIYPNFMLNDLIKKQKKKIEDIAETSKKLKMDSRLWEWQTFLATEEDGLQLSDVEHMLKALQEKKRKMLLDSAVVHNKILLEFLQDLGKRKKADLDRLKSELSVVEQDIDQVQDALEESRQASASLLQESVVPDNGEKVESSQVDKKEQLVPKPSASSTSEGPPSTKETFNTLSQSSKVHQSWFLKTLSKRRRKLALHFDDLNQCYFNTRLGELAPNEERNIELLGEFSNNLKQFTQFSSIRPVATLSYASDVLNPSNIVSSIDFDKDCDHFAVAGVTKKIKVYDYESVVNNVVDGINYPVVQMACNSKISCLSWSKYHKTWLASSDYDGSVTLWDAFTGQRIRMFQEHEKRCWSVDFNTVDLRLLASGSDDAHVKLWSTNTSQSVGCIEAKANVCCVKFNPESSFHLVFGCADHFVHYYDIRKPNQSLGVFKGHKKAVSYAKFVSRNDIVSASTDSELKLWNVNSPNCIRSFRGHTNEKNFVGLATDGTYIACGSENNSLYVYYKGLSNPLLTYKFDVVKSVLDRDNKDEDGNEFVSAVVWRENSNILTAANSQGTIKILELV